MSAVDESGFARTDKFDGVAETADQLVIHGIDGAFGWQLLIHKNSEAASMSFATADVLIGGFGTCTKSKTQQRNCSGGRLGGRRFALTGPAIRTLRVPRPSATAPRK